MLLRGNCRMGTDFCIESKTVRLRPLAQRDIEALRVWRNDPALAKFLSPLPHLTPTGQQAWFDRYQQDPGDEQILAIEALGPAGAEFIGSITLSDLSAPAVTCGKFLIGNSAWRGRGLGSESLRLCLRLVFERLGAQACCAYAHPLNPPSLVAWVNAGFRITGTRPCKAAGADGFEYCFALPRERYFRLQG